MLWYCSKISILAFITLPGYYGAIGLCVSTHGHPMYLRVHFAVLWNSPGLLVFSTPPKFFLTCEINTFLNYITREQNFINHIKWVNFYRFHGNTHSPQHFSSPSRFFSASSISTLIWFIPSSIRSSCSKYNVAVHDFHNQVIWKIIGETVSKNKFPKLRKHGVSWIK